MRQFLVFVAKEHGLDALVPETWYNFPSKIIEEIKVNPPPLEWKIPHMRQFLTFVAKEHISALVPKT